MKTLQRFAFVWLLFIVVSAVGAWVNLVLSFPHPVRLMLFCGGPCGFTAFLLAMRRPRVKA